MTEIPATSKEPKDIYYKPNTKYSITINPSDKFQYAGREDRLMKVRAVLESQMIFIKSDYLFYIELSEPRHFNQDKIGSRVHFHGTISFPTKQATVDFLVSGLYRLSRFADIDIDTIEDQTYWDAYCTKQQHLFEGMSEFKPISNKYNINKPTVKKQDPCIIDDTIEQHFDILMPKPFDNSHQTAPKRSRAKRS